LKVQGGFREGSGRVRAGREGWIVPKISFD